MRTATEKTRRKRRNKMMRTARMTKAKEKKRRKKKMRTERETKGRTQPQ